MQLIHNARIQTLNPEQPAASAVLINAGRVVALGGDELLDMRAEKINLGGRVILPGLTDAHIHLQHYALSLQKIDCATTNRAECLRRVAERVNQLKAGEWVLGHGWDQTEWEHDGTTGWPSASELDAISSKHPIYLTAHSLHAAWVNTAALQLAGINSNTPNPENGEIQRDAHGQPTGVLLESAMDLVSTLVAKTSVVEVVSAIRGAMPMLWKMGLTGVHDFDRRICFMALQHLHLNGELKLRVTKSIPVEDLPYAEGLGLRTGFGDDFLRIGMVKVFMDGALGPRTAAMLQPYNSEPHNRGILNMDAETFFEHARRAADAGLGMTVHAIGDRANHEVLNAYEQLRAYERTHALPALRHRIEHVQVLHSDDVPRLAQLGLIASMQPIHATSDMYAADKFWGAERNRFAYGWREQKRQGAQLAFGSDAPVDSPNPFLGLHAAVTRRRVDGAPGPEGWVPAQRLNIHESIEAYTLGPAYAAGMENRLGRLAPNYLADMIVLERSPFDCPPDELHSLRPVATLVNGEWVWRSI